MLSRAREFRLPRPALMLAKKLVKALVASQRRRVQLSPRSVLMPREKLLLCLFRALTLGEYISCEMQLVCLVICNYYNFKVVYTQFGAPLFPLRNTKLSRGCFLVNSKHAQMFIIARAFGAKLFCLVAALPDLLAAQYKIKQLKVLPTAATVPSRAVCYDKFYILKVNLH